MTKRFLSAVILGLLVAVAAAYSQAPDFAALVRTGTPQAIQAAIANGADLTVRDTASGRTVLMIAATYNPNPGVVSVLVKAGADAKVITTHGRTALDYARDSTALYGTDVLQKLTDASK